MTNARKEESILAAEQREKQKGSDAIEKELEELKAKIKRLEISQVMATEVDAVVGGPSTEHWLNDGNQGYGHGFQGHDGHDNQWFDGYNNQWHGGHRRNWNHNWSNRDGGRNGNWSNHRSRSGHRVNYSNYGQNGENWQNNWENRDRSPSPEDYHINAVSDPIDISKFLT